MINESDKEKPAPWEKPHPGATEPAATVGGETVKDADGAPTTDAPAAKASAAATPREDGAGMERTVRPEAPSNAAKSFTAGARSTATSRPAPVARKRSRLAPALWTILALLALAVAAYLTRPYWAPQIAERLPGLVSPTERTADREAPGQEVEKPPTEDTAVAVTALQAQTTELRSQLSALGARLDTLQSDIRALGERLEAGVRDATGAREPVQQLSDRVAQLEAARSGWSKEDAARLDTIEQRIARLDAAVQSARQGGADAAATVLAVNQLGEALRSGGAYAMELESVKVLTGDDAAVGESIAALEPRATVGLPTATALRARFADVADRVARAETPEPGGGWIDQTLHRLTSLVMIRRTGSAAFQAGGVDAALAAAEDALAVGDLAAAVDALSGLEGAAAEAADGWLADARARLTADRALASLQARAVARLAAKG